MSAKPSRAPRIAIPKGWRKLLRGDRLKEGDRFVTGDATEWEPIQGCFGALRQMFPNYSFIRRIAPKRAKAEAVTSTAIRAAMLRYVRSTGINIGVARDAFIAGAEWMAARGKEAR